MSLDNDKELLERQYLFKLKAYIPKSSLFFYVFVFFKILPIIILTHDWNLNYEMGISAILNQFSLGPILSKLEGNTEWRIIIIIIVVFTVISIVIYIICRKKLFKYQKLSNKWRIAFHFNSLYIFFLNFVFSQQVYILIIESLFGITQYAPNLDYKLIDSIVFEGYVNVGMFYTLLIFEIFIIVFSVISSYLILMVYFEPFYSGHSCLVNNFERVHINWILFSLSQMITQLEYHIPFTYMIYIKCAGRGLYLIYFIYYLLSQKTFFYSNDKLNTFIAYVLSMCFVSAIIEFVFLYDYKNNLIILNSNMNYVILKLILEFVLSEGIIRYVKMQEMTNLIIIETKKHIDAFSIYSSYNKLFYLLSNPNSKRPLLVKIFRAFYFQFCEHQLNCKAKATGCYCNEYYPETFYDQSYKFFLVYDNQKAKVSGEKKNLKDQFPSYYSFIEHSLLKGIEKNRNSVVSNQYLLLCVLFYLEFDKNINKSFYFLEEYMKSAQYRKSLLCKIQVHLLRKYIKRKFYDLLRKSNDVLKKKHYHQFKNIIHYIHIERSIKNAFEVYNNFVFKCSEQSITYKDFFSQMKLLSDNIEIDKDFFINFFQNEKCLHLHLCAELTLYYKFFYHELPDDISLCFMNLNKLEELLKFENSKQIIISFSNTPHSLFNIDYASHTLIQDLEYPSSKEIKSRSLKEIVLSNFSSPYEHYLKEEVHKGNTFIAIPYLCLVSINSAIRVYSLKALVIIMGDKLKIFGTLSSFEDQVLTEYNEDKVTGKEMSIKPCYSITKSNGKIIGVNEEFQKYFLLNSRMITKLQLNVFKDFLKSIPPKSNPNQLYIKPLALYSQLLTIHEETMLENNSSDYLQIFIQLKDIKSKLVKSPILQHFILNFENIAITSKEKSKNYYLLYFSIEGEKKKTLSSFDIFLNSNNQSRIAPTTSMSFTQPISKSLNYSIFQEYNLKLNFQYTKSPSDIIEKLALIKLQALKVLFYKYNIHGHIIEQFIQKKVDLNGDYESLFNNQKHEMRKKLSIKKSVVFQFILMLIVLVIFCIFIILITVYDKKLIQEIENTIFCGLYFLLTKKEITSLTGIVIDLQLKGNGIFGDKLDGTFPNDNKKVVELLQLILTDYVEFFRKFTELFKDPNNYKNLNKVKEISEVFYPFHILNTKLQTDFSTSTLAYSLYFLHYKIARIVNKGYLSPLLYNNTNSDGITSYYPKYFIDNPGFENAGSELFNPEEAAVFLVENSILNLRYPFAEAINIMDITTKEQIDASLFFLFIMCLVNSFLLLILFIYQLFFYYHLYQRIFAKAFIDFCYLQYFNLLLLKKTFLLRSFIEIATIETVMKNIMLRVTIQNNEVESALIASKTEQIDYDYHYDITPFQVFDEHITIKEYAGVDFKKTLYASNNSQKKITQTNLMKLRNNVTAANLNQTNDQKVNRITNQASSLLQLVSAKRRSFQVNLNKDAKPKEPPIQSVVKFINTANSGNDKSGNIHNHNTSGNETHQNLIHNQLQSRTETDKADASNRKKTDYILEKQSMICIICLFASFCIFSFLVSFIYYFIFTEEFELLSQYTELQQASLIRIDTFHESMIGYILTLMKNKQIVFEYQSHGYLANNDNNTREVLKDMIDDFDFFNRKFSSLFNSKSQTAFSVNTVEYNNIIHSKDFCELSCTYITKANSTDGLRFSLIDIISSNDFIRICNGIGKGFNSQGFYNAIVGLMTYIKDSYDDFLREPNRDEKYITAKLTDSTLQSYYVETIYILEFVYMNFHYAISEDYQRKMAEVKIYSLVYLIIVVVCLVMIAGIYAFRLTKGLVEEVDHLEQIETILYHTIVF